MRRSIVSICVLQAFSPYLLADIGIRTTPVELQAVDINASHDSDSADGPVNGYRATRSRSATRTDTALHETPQAVTVVSKDVAEDIAATRLQDALDYAGGVGRANNFGGLGLTTFTVRGFTSGEFYSNGFALNRGYPSAPDANTLERLEVLRGPAALMYGRGDPGGTFNALSKQPLSTAALTLGSQFSDQGLQRGTLDAGGPLDANGVLTYRLNVLAEGGKTFRDGVSVERYGIAPVLGWQVNDSTRVVLEGDFARNSAPLDRGRVRYAAQNGQRASRDTNIWEKGTTNNLHNDNDRLQLRIEHQLNDDWSLGGGVQWLQGTLAGNGVEANSLQADGRTLGRNFNYRKLDWSDRDAQLNLTGHFSTGGLEHTLVSGIEVDDYDYRSIILRSGGAATDYPIDIYQPVLGQARPALTRTTTHDKENLKTYALFIQDQIALTERLKAQLGARLERFEDDYTNKLTGKPWSAADNALTPRFGLLYDLTDTLAVYANTARSFKPNSGADFSGSGFAPEKGKSYELGLKWEALDRQLNVDAAVYHIDKRNVLTSDAAHANFSVAAGEVRSQGLDINVAGNLTPEWRVIGGYAFVDAEVTQDTTLKSGTRLANVPRNSFSLLNVYEFQQGSLNGLGLGVGVKHVGERAGQTTTTTFTMDDYSVVDLLAFYKVNRHLRLTLDVKNLFNRDYDEGSFQNVYAYPGAPRTVQAGFSYSL